MASAIKPGKVPTKPSAAAGKVPGSKGTDVHTIPNPLPYLDKLATSEEVGNTPRPSQVQDSFFKGMRLLNLNVNKAEGHLVKSVKEAQKNLKGPKVPKIDVERMAYACMGLGYACVVKGNVKKAVTCYGRSIQFWGKIHALDSPLLLPLLADSIILRIVCNDKKVKGAIKRVIAIHKAFLEGDDVSLVNADALGRIAAVASGQKGRSMHVELKDGETKVKIKTSLINELYTLSVAHLETCSTAGVADADKVLFDKLVLFEEFLKVTGGPKVAPKVVVPVESKAQKLVEPVESKGEDGTDGVGEGEGKDEGSKDGTATTTVTTTVTTTTTAPAIAPATATEIATTTTTTTTTTESEEDAQSNSELARISGKVAALSVKLSLPMPTS